MMSLQVQCFKTYNEKTRSMKLSDNQRRTGKYPCTGPARIIIPLGEAPQTICIIQHSALKNDAETVESVM
jgi:hypothetical protein